MQNGLGCWSACINYAQLAQLHDVPQLQLAQVQFALLHFTDWLFWIVDVAFMIVVFYCELINPNEIVQNISATKF